MSPAELVTAVEARGVRLTPRGEFLAVAPADRVPPELREALRAAKPAVLALLRERQARTVEGADWSKVSLWALRKVLEVAVPWSDVPLILAPGCRIAKDLRARDPRPGRVWCVCEALDVLLTGVPPEDARRVAEAKLVFGGSVAGAQRNAT